MTPRYASSDRTKTLASLCRDLKINEADLVSAEQVHGDGIALVTKKDRGRRIPRVDALITLEKGLPLVVRTADCAPILIFDTKNSLLSLVHAGRKGTELGISGKTITELKKLGSDPKDLTIKIGPCIDKCCYPMDIRKENLKQLIKAGVPKENIKINLECTRCNMDKYFSYRGDGPDTGRMHLAAVL